MAQTFNEWAIAFFQAAVGGTLPASGGSGTTSGRVQGAGPSAATAVGDPVGIGGIVNTTAPTSLTSGQRGDVWLGNKGSVANFLTSQDGLAILSINTAGADGLLGTVNAMASRSLTYVFNGTSYDRARGDANAMAVQPALTSTFWSYAAAASGIVNTTTAVTIKAAGGAGVRNYISSIQIDWEVLGTATEVAIRDGAGGTVLWRMKIGTGAAGSRSVPFGTALKGTAATLLEVVTLTASGTGAVYFNAQGWTGI